MYIPFKYVSIFFFTLFFSVLESANEDLVGWLTELKCYSTFGDPLTEHSSLVL